MCGIAGLISDQAIAQKRLDNMSLAISHRGPDDLGQWSGDGVVFLHRRLSIIDLNTGHQPMSLADGSLVVTFNGEIYNYPELRAELEAKGRKFETQSDTEVLLHLYDVEGPSFVARLRGMFAFALLDRKAGQIMLARDHLGQKPLFYCQTDTEFAFASEIKALFAADVVPAKIDYEHLWDHTGLRFCPGETTLFQNVHKLRPGHYMLKQIGDSSENISRYWNLDYTKKSSLSYEEATEKLDLLLQDSVQHHLLSDVPVGSFLSGGVDSSLVSAMAAKGKESEFSTFTVAVKDSDFSELEYSRAAADTIGSDHHEFRVEQDLMLLLPEIIWHLEEPADSHAVGLYLLSRMARPHVKVVVGGDGADETFGGYMRFTKSRIVSAYRLLPRWIRIKLVAPLLNRLPYNFSFYSIADKAKWAHAMSLVEGAEQQYCMATFFGFNDSSRDQLLTSKVKRGVSNADTSRWVAEHYDSEVCSEQTDRVLYTEQMTRMPEYFLQIADRMSMAHGLEMRSPLVDSKVTEFAASLPSKFKIQPGSLKIILREVARRYFPAKLIDRKKMGFKFPMGRWFKGPLSGFIAMAFDEARVIQEGIFEREYVERIIREHQNGSIDHNFKIWYILNIEVWYRLFIDAQPKNLVHAWIEKCLVEGTGTCSSSVE